MSVVSYLKCENLGVLCVDNPPVNAISQAVRQGLLDCLALALEDGVDAILLYCVGKTFMAGADIKEFGKPSLEPSLPEVCQAIENSDKPVIAVIQGQALGGGYEIALSCHYRIADAQACVGLPEVKLGLVPGAGGTQRVPRIAGVATALALMTSGEPMAAERAKSKGLVDHLVSEALFDSAQSHIKNLLAGGHKFLKTAERQVPATEGDQALLDQYRQQLTKKKRGQLAPQYVVDCIEDALKVPLETGLANERQRFLQCRSSTQSAAMRHLFAAERSAAKLPGISKNTETRAVNRVAVIGGGTMGAGIAICFLDAGLPVTLLERDAESLDAGLARIEAHYQKALDKGRISEGEKALCLGALQGTTAYDDLAQQDLVVEAVFENMDIKQQVFAELDRVCKPGAVLATNTSYLDINDIAHATARPGDVVGLHFFSPANMMRLLEIVRTDATREDVLMTSLKLAKSIGKVPVVAGVCYGFIGNRMLRAYNMEVQKCLLEGATPEQVDRVMEDFGMAMGPLAVGDLAGLDIGYKARRALPESQRDAPVDFCISDALVEAGRLGQKSGSGYYRYHSGSRQRHSDPEVIALIQQKSDEYQIRREAIADHVLLQRLLTALTDEGDRILEEGVASRSSDIDVVYVNGYGFPAYRGGPMFYRDNRAKHAD